MSVLESRLAHGVKFFFWNLVIIQKYMLYRLAIFNPHAQGGDYTMTHIGRVSSSRLRYSDDDDADDDEMFYVVLYINDYHYFWMSGLNKIILFNTNIINTNFIIK